MVDMPIDPYYLDRGVSPYERGLGTSPFTQSVSGADRPLLAQARGSPPVVPSPPIRFRLRHADKRFASCAEAGEELSVREPGEAKPGLAGRIVKFSTFERDGKFVVEVETRWTLDPSKTTITMPRWTWPKMTKAEKEAVRK